MEYSIGRTAVIGAGPMGAGIAAHLVNCGLQVLLLDRVPTRLSPADMGLGLREDMPEWRNKLARTQLEKTLLGPASAYISPQSLESIKFGNIEDNIHEIRTCDWIIETIVEDLELKQGLYSTIEMHRRPDSIVSTNTGGLPVHRIAAEFSDNLAEHFLGTHFSHPLACNQLVEVVPGPDTVAGLIDFMVAFLGKCLGKRPLVVRDAPGFICNRLGLAAILNAFHLSWFKGFSVEETDALCGEVLGRNRGAAFKNVDAMGLDTAALIIHNIREHAVQDEDRAGFVMPDYVQGMIEKRLLGAKTGRGFYATPGEGALSQVLDLDSLEYRPCREVSFSCLQAAAKPGTAAGRIRAVVRGKDRGAGLAWEVLAAGLNYAANRLGEIADTVEVIDKAMQWGYAWQLGPFECWDAIGVKWSVQRMRKEGRLVSPLVEGMLTQGFSRFYINKAKMRYYFDFRSHMYQPCRVE